MWTWIKKALQKPLTVHIENVRLALERWVFIVTFNVMESLLKECTPPALTIERLRQSKKELRWLPGVWLETVGRLLTWLVVACVIPICLLLPLMLVLVLYVVEQALVLSLRGLTYLRTRLSQARTK